MNMILEQMEEVRLAEDARPGPRCTQHHPGPGRCCRKPSVPSIRGGKKHRKARNRNNLDDARNAGHVSRNSTRSGRSNGAPKTFSKGLGHAQAPKQSSLPKHQKHGSCLCGPGSGAIASSSPRQAWRMGGQQKSGCSLSLVLAGV